MEDFESILQQQQFDGGTATGVLDHEWVTSFTGVSFTQPHSATHKNNARHYLEVNKRHTFIHKIFCVSCKLQQLLTNDK